MGKDLEQNAAIFTWLQLGSECDMMNDSFGEKCNSNRTSMPQDEAHNF